VWEYAGVNSFREGRDDLELHPTVKPVDHARREEVRTEIHRQIDPIFYENCRAAHLTTQYSRFSARTHRLADLRMAK
jgi:hypothetical protein